MQRKLSAFLPPLALILISLILCFKNYTPGTFLSGWDTLHPEFNLSLNLERLIFGVFRDEQGLGAVAGHSHISEIPRVLILSLLDIFFPTDFLRYSYIFLCLILGTLGSYFFLKRFGVIPAFLGSLFYLLNLSTLQHFYVPFEMFPTQFAALPYLFLFAVRFLEEKKPKFLVLFSVATLLSTPMAYAATLWYSYFLCFSLFLISYNFLFKDGQLRKASVKLILATLLINSFWLLPNFYFIATHAKEVSESKIHSLFTEEAFAQNASFGTFSNVAIFKNYLFNWGEHIGNNQFGPLLDEWSKHLENPFVLALGFLFFLLVILGAFWTVRVKNKLALSFLPVFLLSLFFLLNVNPPLGFLFQFLQDNVPLLKEALRFPFNKFSIILVFVSSIYLSFLISRVRRAQILLFLSITLALIIYMQPAFTGNLISKSMRVNIPSDYFELFDYFDKEDKGRVAVLPIHSFWGWVYNDFGYQGAGFLWFGIKQSFLDRDFDRWQKFNEQYYREMSYAIYSQDSQLLENVLSKYNISHILIDKSVLPAGQDPNTLYLNEIEALLATSNIPIDRTLGKLSVYKVNSRNSNLFVVKDYKFLSPIVTASYEDKMFGKYGHYSYKDGSETIFPFADLIDNQNRILEGKINISQEGLKLPIPKEALERPIVIPDYSSLEKLFAVDLNVEKRGSLLRVTFLPRFPRSETPLLSELILPTNERNFLLSINKKDNFTLNNLQEFTPLNLGTVFLMTDKENTISLYGDRNDLELKPDFTNFPLNITSCGEDEGTFGATPAGNSFTLYGENTSVCLMLPLSSLRPYFTGNQGLLGLSFTASQHSVCIADLKSGSCKDFDLRNITLNPVTLNKANSFFEVEASDFQNLGIKFFLDATDGPKSVRYEDITITFKNPLANVPFVNEVREALSNFKLLGEFNIPFSGNPQLSQDITNIPKTSGDCPQGPGIIAQARKTILKKEFENYIRYEADEGSFCDHFSYENLPSDQSYIIVIRARNVAGLPARVCIANRSNKRCDIYAHIQESQDFTNNIFLLPPTKSTEPGFDVNINNFAVKNIPSINDIAGITVIPFPYSWLSQIETQSSNTKASTLNIPETEFSSPNKSVFMLETEFSNGDLLVLPQSYEAGWKAYEVSDLNFLSGTFPFLGGKELNHVLVSGWANGFEMNPGKSKVVILFLPQYLEYLGFLFLAGTFIYLGAKRHEL